jgi:hypothetical protein
VYEYGSLPILRGLAKIQSSAFESVNESFHFEFSALQAAMDLLVRADAAMSRQATDSELKHAA